MTNKVLWVLAFAIFATDLFAQSNLPNSGGLITDGTIYSSTSQGDKLYIGGTFNYVGKNTPYITKINKTTGEVDLNFLKPNDIVYAIISDGNGGWYLGGAFTKIGDVTRNGLARINADGSLHSWDPNVTGSTAIKTLLMLNGRIYFGGRFTTVNGNVSRKNLAAVDTVAGTVLSWNPNMTSGTIVNSIVSSGANLYMGGIFTIFNSSVSRNRAAATDTTAGTLLSWNPNINGTVNTMSVYGSSIYLGGSFTTVNSSTGRNRLTAVDLTTGTATSWNPNANSTINCITIDGNTLYAGGNFTSILSNTRTRLAAIDLTTGLLTNWAPTFSNQVWSIFPHSGIVYVGGQFIGSNSVNGTTYRNCVAAIDASNASVSNWNPSIQDIVYSMQANSTSIFMAGQFVSAGGDIRKNLAAVNVSTGTLDPNWKPDANGSIRSLIMNNNLVYAGGSFTTINSTARELLAAIDTSSGTLTSWYPKVVGNYVMAMTLNGNTLYVGGNFATVNATNTARTNLAAFDTTSGIVNSWNPTTDGTVRSIFSGGSSIYVGGEFTSVNGNSLRGLARIDKTTGLVPGGWSATLNGDVYSLLYYENKLYLGGNYTTINSTTRNRIASLNPSTGALYNWNPNASGTVWALYGIGSTIFMGGSFTSIGGVTRNGAASVDTTTGATYSWDAGIGSSVFTFSNLNNILHIAGSFSIIAGNLYRSLASYSLPTSPDAPVITGITPSNAQLSIAFSNPSDGGSAITNYKYSLDNGSSYIACSPAVITSPLTITGLSNGTTYNIIMKAVNAFGDGSASFMSSGTPQAPSNTWVGGTGNWNVAGNWSLTTVPDGSTDIIISSGTPALNVDLTLSAGKTLTLSGSGSLIISPDKRLTISGTADFGGKSVTLKSDATGTATIGQITGTLSNDYNVTVERYIPATGRRYRLITPSVTTSGTIKDNWMEGGLNNTVGSYSNPNAGYGVQITGAGGNANGFDVTTSNSASVYATTNGTTLSYAPISNTNATLNALTGYFVFVRGDRSQNMTLPNTNVAPNPVPLPSSATTLRATGTLLQGTQTSFTNALNSSTGAMNLVTNPYASAIDWSAVYAASSGISDAYTLWEPSIGYRGGFVTVTAAGVKSNGSSNASTTIQPGQAFFVTATGSGTASVSIQESHKTTTGMSSAVFGTSSPMATTAQLGLSLYFNEASGYRRLADGVKALYNSNYQSALDGNDAFEIPNWDENLAISSNGQNLAIESRPNIINADTLNLSVGNLKAMNYELQVDAGNFNNSLLKASVVDKFTGAKTPVSLSSTTNVPFTVTTDPASSASNRFSVIFSTAAALPLNFLSFQGKVAGNYTQLNWQVTGEERLERYEVEKSIDGEHFSLLGRTTPKANNQPSNSYQWNDAALQSGNSFYRIRSVSLDGTINYSKTVKITLGSKLAQVQVYPNPVRNGKANLQVEQLSAGSYRLEWYNSQGQLLKASALQHPGGFFIHNVDVPAMQGVVNWKLTKGEQNWKGTVVVGSK